MEAGGYKQRNSGLQGQFNFYSELSQKVKICVLMWILVKTERRNASMFLYFF
jgi:hypothetical protein